MWILVIMNIGFLIWLWTKLHTKRKIIGFHTGMNIVMSISGFFAILIGILFIQLYPFLFLEITILTMLISGGVGAIFGALFDYQTLLTGVVNGAMTGVMAPMLGSVVQEDLLLYSLQILFLLLVLFIQYILIRT